MARTKPLRVRIREAGGLYHWANARLIRYAGPASVGRMDEHTPPPCAGCGYAKSAHSASADGSLRCPPAP